MTAALGVGDLEHCKPRAAGSVVRVAEYYFRDFVVVVDEPAEGKGNLEAVVAVWV